MKRARVVTIAVMAVVDMQATGLSSAPHTYNRAVLEGIVSSPNGWGPRTKEPPSTVPKREIVTDTRFEKDLPELKSRKQVRENSATCVRTQQNTIPRNINLIYLF